METSCYTHDQKVLKHLNSLPLMADRNVCFVIIEVVTTENRFHCLTWLTLIPALMNIYINYKVWDEIICLSSNFNGTMLKFGSG